MKFSRDGENRRLSTIYKILLGEMCSHYKSVGVNTAENIKPFHFRFSPKKSHRAGNPKRWEFWRVNRGVRRRRRTYVRQSEQHAKKMKFSRDGENRRFSTKEKLLLGEMCSRCITKVRA